MNGDMKLAIIGILVEEKESVKKLNDILSSYAEYIIGRMGLPRREEGVNMISIFVEAPQDVINTLSGKLGNLSGVSSKVIITRK